METVISETCWCKGKRNSVAFKVEVRNDLSFSFVRCDSCGVLCIVPTPAESELLSYYDAEYYGSSQKKFNQPVAWIISHFQRKRAKLVSQFIPEGGKILDIGCGNGGFLRKMHSKGYKLEGTELSKKSALRASKKYNFPVHTGDLLSINLPHKSYDAISLWHVFEHLLYPLETLNKIQNLLKDDGALFLSLPNQESWQARLFDKEWFHLDPPRHLFSYGINSVRQLLELTGFKIEKVSTFSLEYNIYGFIQSTLNAIGLPRDRAYNLLKSGQFSMQPHAVINFFLILTMASPALGFEVFSSLFRKGATMLIQASKQV